ncbi:hypothetical protein [Fusobacterium sp. IOR10]|uniref:hypothetical protein n=1 Tax=Fusobacterium sp. IOR10 TaxID=2665157 RepID=UPI0013D82BAB|nr:hypothetical protein [Fusobacterium sp. IOR10]
MSEIGRVVEIMDQYTIMICFKNKIKFKKGTKIKIFETGEKISDFEGNDVEIMEIYKDIVEVVEHLDKVIICQSIERIETNPFIIPTILTRKYTKKLRSLNVNSEDFTNRIFKTEAPIKKGDYAKILE